jgi:sigma-B regulation protein RsbU (phosphoserine phosphatase)
MAQPEISLTAAVTSQDWSWATVMVVDDEEINRDLLAAIARRNGIGTIVQASDGLDCLRKLETVHPDLIILDIVMPNLDGFATCTRIRAIPAWADIPILVQTALTTPQDVLACFEAGASDVVAKPIRPAELSARLRVHLENRRMVRTLRDTNQRIHKEMKGAREMQRTLFPAPALLDHLRSSHGLAIEGRVEPLDGVGGDIWAVHPLSDTLVAVMMADFSGHGLMPALNTFWLHAFISKQSTAMREPADFLKLLNGALRSNLMRGHFATFFFGLIDLERDELRWSGAGAPKPVLLLNGDFHQLDTTGLPLGLTERASYTNHSVAFPPGAKLLLFSDGLTDIATEDGTRLESHGLLERLQPHLSRYPDADLNSILDAVVPPGRAQLSDDTTAVWIRRHHQHNSAPPTNAISI